MIITYVLPKEDPKTYETFAREVIIGRSPAASGRLDIDLISDLYVSHAHARLIHEEDQCWVEDLGSANGTFVDGKKIKAKTLLQPGAQVKIGWTMISVRIPELSDTMPRAMPPGEALPEGEQMMEWTSTEEEINLWVSDEEMDLEWVSDEENLPWDSMAEEFWGGELPSATVDRNAPVTDPNRATRLVKKDVPPQGKSDDDDLAATAIKPPSEPIAEKPGNLSNAKTVTRDKTGEDLAATVVGQKEPAPGEGPGRGVSDKGLAGVSVEPTVITTPPPLPVAAPEEDETQGDVIKLTDSTVNLLARPNLVSNEDILKLVWRQLKAFNELGRSLDSAKTLNELVNLLVSLIPGVIPNALRGAVLMPDDQDRLLLKAHWPAGEHSVSMTWVQRAYETREPFIWSLPEDQCKVCDTPSSALFYQVQSAIYVPLMIGDKALGVMYVDNYHTRDAFSATDFELLKAISSHVALFVRDRLLHKVREREKAFEDHLKRKLSPAAAKRVSATVGRLQMGGERADPVTILVSDVRNFTSMSKGMAPHEIVKMLNEMFDAFVPIIFEYGGIVDKYVGDSVLAVFGSPEPDDRQWEKALRAAMEMQQAVRMLGEGRRVRRLPVFEVGISIHSGEAIHGFIGSNQRTEYTVIGDVVNQASRLCDGAARGEVVISQSVYEHVYRVAEVKPKIIRTKHADTEPDLNAYVVTRLL